MVTGWGGLIEGGAEETGGGVGVDEGSGAAGGGVTGLGGVAGGWPSQVGSIRGAEGEAGGGVFRGVGGVNGLTGAAGEAEIGDLGKVMVGLASLWGADLSSLERTGFLVRGSGAGGVEADFSSFLVSSLGSSLRAVPESSLAGLMSGPPVNFSR